ncbi:MAG TPA: DUF6390 family protein [Gaiellaceae bacterium]|nr:DUF6390 family protein [Gaiellaceae bacterium]
MSDAAGALLFARYAYPPNSLGLCGADSPGTLLEYGDAGESDGGLAELARTFDGAWPYLTLIAERNGIADPLDSRVVEAYWVGNGLLERVPGDALARHVVERFHGRLGKAEQTIGTVAVEGAVPHHCFHVFAVYPWLGLLRGGMVEQPLHVLDQCRTTAARVVARDGDEADVLAPPLLWENGELHLGQPALRRVRWRSGGRAFVAPPEPGDLVSLHWDFVSDVLTPSGAGRLDRVTRRVIALVNRGDGRGSLLAA